MLKISLLFKKFTGFMGAREFIGLRMRNFESIVFIYEHKHIGGFSNLH